MMITDTFIKQKKKTTNTNNKINNNINTLVFQLAQMHAQECSRTGQQNWRAGILNVCPHCAAFLSISCSCSYREVGMGLAEHFH